MIKCVKVTFKNGDSYHFYVFADTAQKTKEWYINTNDNSAHVLICRSTEYILLKSNISIVAFWDVDTDKEDISII